jgi:hypothetical protein
MTDREAFDHSIGEGRYVAVRGSFWWHIKIGDGTALHGKFHSQGAAEDMALKLLTAFRDGAFEAWQAATAAERERCAKVCDEWTKENHVYVNGAIRCAEDIRRGP